MHLHPGLHAIPSWARRLLWHRFLTRLQNQTTEDFELNDYVTVHLDPEHSFQGHVVALGGGLVTVERWDAGTHHPAEPTSVSHL